MADEKTTPNSSANDKGAEDTSLLDGNKGAKKEDGSLIDDASKEAEAQKQAEEKRLIEAKDEELSSEDKAKKDTLIKEKKDAEAKQAQEAKAKGAPEKYDIKVPEGMTLDQTSLDKVSPIFKEIGLNNEQAQKLADAYMDIQKAQAEKQEASFQTFVKELKEETIKELGANYKEQLAFAAKVKERFLSPETMEKLNATGLSNDKNIVSDLIKIGRLIAEDKLVDGKSDKLTDKSPADVMYGK